jgi:hypothetical protein
MNDATVALGVSVLSIVVSVATIAFVVTHLKEPQAA